MAKQKKSHSSKHNPDNQFSSLAKLSGITIEILSLNLVIIGGGYYLGGLVESKIPWILIFSVFLSVAATIFYLLKRTES